MHQLIEDKGSSDGACDRVRLRLQCLAFAARLRRSSALCGCPSCLELDQAENNPRVTLLPLRVTDRDKWEKGDDIPRVQEKIMAKPQKIPRLFRPKTTKETVPAPQGHPEVSRDRRRRARSAPSFFLLKRLRYLRRAVDLANFLRYFFSDETLVETLETHPPPRHALQNAMMWLSVVPGARPGREQPARNTTSTPRNRSGQVGKGR